MQKYLTGMGILGNIWFYLLAGIVIIFLIYVLISPDRRKNLFTWLDAATKNYMRKKTELNYRQANAPQIQNCINCIYDAIANSEDTFYGLMNTDTLVINANGSKFTAKMTLCWCAKLTREGKASIKNSINRYLVCDAPSCLVLTSVTENNSKVVLEFQVLHGERLATFIKSGGRRYYR